MPRTARRRTVWVPLLVLVLAANLVFMLWWGNRQAGAPQAPSGAPPTAAVPPEQASGAARPLAAEAGLATVEDAPFAATADLPAVDPEAVTEVLGPSRLARHRVTGLVSVPAGCTRDSGPVEVRATRPAGVNLPTAAVVEATREIVDMVANLGPRDLAIAVVTGGGSALLEAPGESVPLVAMIALTPVPRPSSRGKERTDAN